MKKKSAEDYLDKLLNSVNDEKEKKEKFKETAKMLEDAMSFWDSDIPDSELEEAEYEQLVAKESKKSEREDFLDALLSGAKDTEFGMNRRKPDTNPMYSRRVSKSEADFLKEFEEELAGAEDDLGDLFAEFENAVEPEDRLASEDIHAVEQEESFTLGDVDLAALVGEVADVISKPEDVSPLEEMPMEEMPLEEIPMEEIPMEEISAEELKAFTMSSEPVPMDDIPEDMFDALFSGEPMQNSSEEIDLGNLGDDDLMNLLAGTDDLADIGNMLSNGEATEIPLDELDAFSVFAESEMSAQQISAEPAIEEELVGKKANKKGGFLAKLKAILGGLLKDDEDGVTLKPEKSPTPETLSSENADIFAELDALEEKPTKKEKKKKEKKKKEKKPKATKKPKAPKAPKPKKEKKPKEVDNTPPLPKGPVFMIWVMAASMVVLVLLGVNLTSYNTAIADAKSLQNQGHYAEAFTELNGLTIKEKDTELYGQLAVLATIDSEINAYEIFLKADVPDKAFDSLICAAGRCYLNAEDADVFGCLGQLEILKTSVSNELHEKYNMTYEEALEMYKIRHRDDYTLALYKKLTELGIEWD